MANFTRRLSLPLPPANIFSLAQCALINLCGGGGFNPPGFTPQRTITNFRLPQYHQDYTPKRRPWQSQSTDSQASVNSAKNVVEPFSPPETQSPRGCVVLCIAAPTFGGPSYLLLRCWLRRASNGRIGARALRSPVQSRQFAASATSDVAMLGAANVAPWDTNTSTGRALSRSEPNLTGVP